MVNVELTDKQFQAIMFLLNNAYKETKPYSEDLKERFNRGFYRGLYHNLKNQQIQQEPEPAPEPSRATYKIWAYVDEITIKDGIEVCENMDHEFPPIKIGEYETLGAVREMMQEIGD